ncbi:MAG: L-serine ammonia-lyase [Acetobacteraceae bacterium]
MTGKAEQAGTEAARRKAEAPISVVELFTIGIGPSSSHTVGPMRAALRFAERLGPQRQQKARRIVVELFGSLALTGKGHRTDEAVILGLLGWRPDTVDPERIPALIESVRQSGSLLLAGRFAVRFVESEHLFFRKGEFLPQHPNALRFSAFFDEEPALVEQYYSIGGGAIRREGETPEAWQPGSNVRPPYPFTSAAELLAIGRDRKLSIAGIVRANEAAWRTQEETTAYLDRVRAVMLECIDRGCRHGGTLPGGLHVRRRAKALYDELVASGPAYNPSRIFEWVSLYALAVNEENAGGGRMVTAPTNGGGGVIPAVLKYYETFIPGASREGSQVFLLTAAAIGALYKKRASISAAEMGCQGEVGVACSMAAGALAASLGGSNGQVENAAEIGMEHNLGLTCDPIKGLVQVPCIERNTMGAVKAINAAYLALRGDGTHVVPLDTVIETMRQTGQDMRSKYKETSLGGLAVNFVQC